MKMFLTRMGFGSTAVVTGDITQIDLPNRQLSGLKQIINVLQDIPEVSFSFFQPKDVVRHTLVKSIVKAYDRYDELRGDKTHHNA
jgi:phosphate starvation-inducible PhoH-like protein